MLPVLFACERKPKVITVRLMEDFLKAVDAASARKDPQLLLDHIAPDALITVKLHTAAGPQIIRLNGKDYRERAKAEFAALKDYKYQRSDTKIEISKDQQKARVSMKVVELLAAAQGNYRVEAKQLTTYVLKDGKLLIQSVESESAAVQER